MSKALEIEAPRYTIPYCPHLIILSSRLEGSEIKTCEFNRKPYVKHITLSLTTNHISCYQIREFSRSNDLFGCCVMGEKQSFAEMMQWCEIRTRLMKDIRSEKV